MNFLTMICLVPIAAFWLGRWFFYRKVIEEIGAHDCRMTTEEMAIKLNHASKLPNALQNKRNAGDLAELLLLKAFEDLRAKHPGPLRVRKRADTFTSVVLPFSLLIALFAMFVGKNASFVMLCVASVNAIGAIMKFSTRSIAAHAVERAAESLRRIRLPRKDDEETILACLNAMKWR